MDSGMYAACTALMARTDALDTVAANLANASTTGYRSEGNVFSSVLAGKTASLSPLNEAINDYGILGGTRLNMTQGSLERTGNELDLAIDGPGFFVVQNATGTFYTRAGNFQVSAHNQLITSHGDAVIGEQGVIPIVGGAMSISSDGTISVNGAVAGKLKVVEFPPGTQLQGIGNAYYSAPRGAAVVAQTSTVRQGMLENSNVDPVASVVELISIQRSAEMMQKALAMFNQDIDKTAAQDLPRLNG